MSVSNQPNPVVRKALFWLRIHDILLITVYLLLVLLGIGMGGIGIYHLANGIRLEDNGEIMMLIAGIVIVVMGALLLIPSVMSLFLPRRPWAWTFHLVMICIGLTSPCFLPLCIPLLIWWFKPELKAYFGKS